MDKPPTRLPLYVGLLLIACGWAAIYLGWRQAGEQELETGQIPFLLSGGFGGWGLLLMGVGGVIVDVIQRLAWTQHRELVRVHGALSGLQAMLEEWRTKSEEAAAEVREREEKAAAKRAKRSPARKSTRSR